MKKLAVLTLGLVVAACSETPTEAPSLDAPPVARSETAPPSLNVVDLANAQLEAQGSEYRVAYAEYLTADYFGNSDNIIIARDLGNKRLSLDFLPDDPRRGGVDGDPNTIDTWIDLTQATTSSGLTADQTTNAISSAMGTWQGVTCSEFGANITPIPVDLGLVQAIFGFGGGPAVPDLMHAGWLPAGFFDLLRPGGSTSILGVTFTLTFVSGDLDGDGRADLAAREIYYNDNFPWADNGIANFDVETVALHEAGHGLSQAHFGTVFFNPRSGKLVWSPEAVMNAVYAGVNRDLYGTDNAGHCGLWGNWPTG